MIPRLVAVTGPLEGQSFEIGETPFSIGRLSSNHLQLLETTASRRHCTLERSGDGLELVDLDSHLGTFLNGLPVKQHRLQHGDFVKIAGSLFLFLERPPEADGTVPVPMRLASGDWTAESTVRISTAPASERSTLAGGKTAPPSPRAMENVARRTTAVIVDREGPIRLGARRLRGRRPQSLRCRDLSRAMSKCFRRSLERATSWPSRILGNPS